MLSQYFFDNMGSYIVEKIDMFIVCNIIYVIEIFISEIALIESECVLLIEINYLNSITEIIQTDKNHVVKSGI